MKKNTEKKNWLEWTVTVISGILVAFTFGFLIYQLLYEEQTPPDIVITLGAIAQKDGGYAVPIQAFNNGTSTAENVAVEVVMENGTTPELSKITFKYLPRKSSANGWITFSTRPQREQLKTRILGYSVPCVFRFDQFL